MEDATQTSVATTAPITKFNGISAKKAIYQQDKITLYHYTPQLMSSIQPPS
jgi:hypothetical protein